MEYKNQTFEGDCLEGLKTLPDQSVNCCVTSPPYFGLRDYGNDGQIGLEETPELFVNKMVDVFREVKRVLRDDGTLWLNLGDSYWGGKGKSGTQSPEQAEERNKSGRSITSKAQQLGGHGETGPTDKKHPVIKPKDLIGIPWMVAFALRADGWYLRQDIIWHKPNPMPESVTDRCTKSHEYIFLLSKSAKYYYDADAIKTEIKESSISRLSQNIENQKGSDRVPNKTNGNMKAVGPHGIIRDRLLDYNSKEKLLRPTVLLGEFEQESQLALPGGMANKKSVWTVNTMPYKGAHFATFPEKLITDCIKAGCPKDGLVLDPFMGAGTTALVARKLTRNYVGFELNHEYIRIIQNRLQTELGILI